MPQTTNRLIHESSPYLLQHAHNPVDWYPWGDEAFQKAKAEDKPILLSCGYSACHWCHVMERESFEDPEIAALMNQYFVNIKVDREERPDLDQIYQQTVQLLTGQGGWPLTVFLDQERKAFFGGTYFPPRPLYGRSSFPQVLEAVHQKWTAERETIDQAARKINRHLQSDAIKGEAVSLEFGKDLPAQASLKLYRHFDPEYGGFDGAPKFPNSNLLQFLVASGVLNRQMEVVDAVLYTLEKMARGGIYDHLGGGFHRYSTDQYWLASHFEKMLYDNAQLLKLYAIAYQLRPVAEFERVVRETADYLRREMLSPAGGFYATQDADSESVEGKYYLWRLAEIQQVLTSEEAQLVQTYYDVTKRGNFEDANILNRLELRQKQIAPNAAEQQILNSAKQKLFAIREKRVKPFLDRKVIAGWNGLALSGLAYAYQVFGREEDYQLARQTGTFLFKQLRLGDGSLARIYMDGTAKVGAMLDDYAFLAQGLLDLYEADFDPGWLEKSLDLTRQAGERFGTPEGLYYLAATGGERLAAQPVSRYDQAIPSGVSVQLSNLLRLAAFTGQPELQAEAERILRAYLSDLAEQAWGMAGFLAQLDLYRHGFCEFVFLSATPEQPELLRKLRQKYLPNRIVAWAEADSERLAHHPARELFAGRKLLGGEPTCYICQKQECQAPVTQWGDLESHLGLKLWDLNRN
jgi:uncharacterized protein YyaL (SSP411 family)